MAGRPPLGQEHGLRVARSLPTARAGLPVNNVNTP